MLTMLMMLNIQPHVKKKNPQELFMDVFVALFYARFLQYKFHIILSNMPDGGEKADGLPYNILYNRELFANMSLLANNPDCKHW